MSGEEKSHKTLHSLKSWTHFFGILGTILGILSVVVLIEGWMVKGGYPVSDAQPGPASAPPVSDSSSIPSNQPGQIPTLKSEAVWAELSPSPSPRLSQSQPRGFLSAYLPNRINIDWGDSAGALASAAAAFLTLATLLYTLVQALDADLRSSHDKIELEARFKLQSEFMAGLVRQMRDQALQMEAQSQAMREQSQTALHNLELSKDVAQLNKEQIQQMNEQSLQMREQAVQMRKQSEIAQRQWQLSEEVATLNAQQSGLAALTAKLNSARARVETMWKGPRLDFADQEFDTDDKTFAHLGKQLTDGLDSESPEYKLIMNELENWRQATKEMNTAIKAISMFAQKLSERSASPSSSIPMPSAPAMQGDAPGANAST